MNPPPDLAAGGARGLVIAGVLLVALVLVVLVVPRVWPSVATRPHATTAAWAAFWLIAGWSANRMSLIFAAKESFGAAWAFYAVSAACGVMAVTTVLWRMAALSRREPDGPR